MQKFLFIVLCLSAFVVSSQNEALAKNYFQQGEYEKALHIYERLQRQAPGRLDYFLALVETNQQLEKFNEAETLLHQRLTRRTPQPQLYIELGHNYALQDKDSTATTYYKKAIEQLEINPRYAYTLGRSFEKYNLLDEAVALYEKAMALNPGIDFNINLARIYGEQGALEKMFFKYIELVQDQPRYRSVVQRNFSQYITEDPTNEANIKLRQALLRALQQNPDILYNNLLSWLFVQQKDYKKALAQEKAIYKRTQGDLKGIKELLYITLDDKAYGHARDIAEFMVENAAAPNEKLLGEQNLIKIDTELATQKDYPAIETKFQKLFEKYGTGTNVYALQMDYNTFLAFKVGKQQQAIKNLKTLSQNKLGNYKTARVKMLLADILVYSEKFNQALIYYSQVQKKVKNDPLAQQARFKVAQTSYYKGDFAWAQTQLDVLKKSTSQLIANDAMQLSLTIRDNSLEDSTQTALKKFAAADLLALQLRYPQAITAYQTILTDHKGEKIEDETLFKQGRLFEKTGQYERAEHNYLKIIQLYGQDILADDAHYYLAQLYENQLEQPDKAKHYFEDFIYNFADSIYFVTARKRYRMLRGDKIDRENIE